MILDRIKNLMNQPQKIVLFLTRYPLFHWMSDEAYLKMIYKLRIGKTLNLDNPVTYNEKLQWLKIHDRRPEYRVFADKYAVRKFLRQTLGDEYLIPWLGVYDTVEDIPWEELPDQFVLKCNHGSGSNIICADKSKLDIEKSKKQLSKWMKHDYFWHGREWQYKDMRPRIICEQFMVDKSGELKDYKLHCCNGKAKFINVVSNRYSSGGINGNYYDLDWNLLPFYQHYPPTDAEIAKPVNFDKMIEIAERICQSLPYMRVDYYEVEGHLYIGELTLYPASGCLEFVPDSADELVGSWINLPK